MVTAMVTAMVTVMNTRIKMIDIHNHLMNNVDDGSKNIEMSEEIIKESQKQGVNVIFLTPHVNSSVTFASREKHFIKFQKLQMIAKEYNVRLFLGSEIYISDKIPNIEFSKYTMGENNVLLIEFSQYNETPIVDHVFNLIKRGYKIIIAHIERYDYLSYEDILELKELGAYIQINCSSLINSKKRHLSKKVFKYIKEGYVDFVASDTHNTSSRKQNMENAFNVLKKKFGLKIANDLLENNQKKLLF